MTKHKKRVKEEGFSNTNSFISSLTNRIGNLFNTSLPEDEHIDYVLDIIEPKLKRVRGYRKRLQGPIQSCLAHCKSMVTEIPGPILINRSSYNNDPVINATFTSSYILQEVLARAKQTEAQKSLLGNKRFGLLTMTSKQKTIFGRKQQGDMIVGDSAMRSISFFDHNIVGLTTTLEASMVALEKYCLDIIAEAVEHQLSELRDNLVDLRKRHEQLRAMNKVFGDEARSSGMGGVFVPYDPEKATKQKKLEQLLLETENEIAEASSKTETPEGWLSIVEELLSKPEDILSMRIITLRLDWKNVLTDDPHERANTVTLATFTFANEMQKEGVLVTYEQV